MFKYRTVVEITHTTQMYPYPDGTEDLGEAAAQAMVLMKQAWETHEEDGTLRRVFIELMSEGPGDADQYIKRADADRQLTLFPDDPPPIRDLDDQDPRSGQRPTEARSFVGGD
jgi:hypothetical protein